jgi:uncharacterized protein (DUF2235 family)
MEAYSFICHNYTDGQDEIYLIGFSRGAFTVRCVAHLIHDEGILKKPYLSHLPEIFNKWRNRVVQSEVCNEPSSGTTMAEPEIQNLNEIGERAMVNISIKACAVWDTVSSVGTGMLFGKPKDLRLVHSDLCPRIEYAYQALSLYERRRPFLPMVWRLPKSPTSGPYARDIANFEQCWFHGYHGDIGGGNDIDMQALAHLPLAWMISKLDGLLSFDKESLWKPNPFPSGWTLRPSDEGVGCK